MYSPGAPKIMGRDCITLWFNDFKGTFGTLNDITFEMVIYTTMNKRCCNGITITIHIYSCKIGIKSQICIYQKL